MASAVESWLVTLTSDCTAWLNGAALGAMTLSESEIAPPCAESDDPWIVAVRMVSEGVDIPRLAGGVYATNTLTDLFFRQAVGRLEQVVGTTVEGPVGSAEEGTSP